MQSGEYYDGYCLIGVLTRLHPARGQLPLPLPKASEFKNQLKGDYCQQHLHLWH